MVEGETAVYVTVTDIPVQAVPVTVPILLSATPSSIKIFGDSFLANDEYGSPSGQGIAGRLQSTLGLEDWQVLNLAVDGGNAFDNENSASWAQILKRYSPTNAWPYLSDGGPAFGKLCTNDRILVAGGDPFFTKGFKESLYTIICRMLASHVYHHDDASVATTAGSPTELLWEDLTDPYSPAYPWGGGDGCWQLDVDDEITISTPSDFPGGYVGLFFAGGYAGATGTIVVNADDPIEFNTADMMWQGFGWDHHRAGYTVRINIPTAGVNVIAVTCSTRVHDGYLWFNEWQIEATNSPIVAVGDMNFSASALAGVDGATSDSAYNTQAKAMSALVSNVVSRFKGSASVALAQVMTAMGNDVLNFTQGDHMHPSPRGAAIFVSELIAAAETVADHMSQINAETSLVPSTNMLGAPKIFVGTGDIGDKDFTFDMANQAGTGYTELVAFSGTWAVESNCLTNDAVGYAVWDSGKSDGSLEFCQNGSNANNNGIVFRADPAAPNLNHFRVITNSMWGWTFVKVVNGVATAVNFNGDRVDGTVCQVMYVGDTIKVYIDGILAYSTIDSTHQTLTGVGAVAGTANGTWGWRYIRYLPLFGNDGDIYIDTEAWAISSKAGGVWGAAIALPVGPKGDKGDTGDTGPTGPPGASIVAVDGTGITLNNIAANTDVKVAGSNLPATPEIGTVFRLNVGGDILQHNGATQSVQFKAYLGSTVISFNAQNLNDNASRGKFSYHITVIITASGQIFFVDGGMSNIGAITGVVVGAWAVAGAALGTEDLSTQKELGLYFRTNAQSTLIECKSYGWYIEQLL